MVTLRPEEGSLHGLQIYHITHQIKGVTVGLVEKVQQEFCFAIPISQVDIGQPDGIVVHGFVLFAATLVRADDRQEAVSRNFDDMAAFQ